MPWLRFRGFYLYVPQHVVVRGGRTHLLWRSVLQAPWPLDGRPILVLSTRNGRMGQPLIMMDGQGVPEGPARDRLPRYPQHEVRPWHIRWRNLGPYAGLDVD